MALKNKSMYAILGILNLAPSTGYDIKKYSDSVLAGFWNENFGHIYPTLKMLLLDGMIEVINDETSESGGNAKKIRYGITDKGRRELETWLLEETLPQAVRSEFMLKLLFSSSQSRDDVIRMLEKYREYHEKNIEKYNEMSSSFSSLNSEVPKERRIFLQAVLRRGIISDEAVVRWCNETIENMREDKKDEQ